MYRIAVAAALPVVGDEMFGGGDDAGRFEFAHKGDAHHRGEQGILAVALLDTAPAHIGGDIDHRRQHLADPARAALPRDGGGSARHQLRIPGGGQPDGLRKGGGAVPHQAVQRLIERDDRNAEAGLLDEKTLGGVDLFSHGRRRSRGVIVENLRRGSSPGGGGVKLQTEYALVELSLVALHIARSHEELPEFLLEGHASQQIPEADIDRQGRIPVREAGARGGIRPRAGGKRVQEQCNNQGRTIQRTQHHLFSSISLVRDADKPDLKGRKADALLPSERTAKRITQVKLP